jgi:hypothetical protein
MDKQDLADMRIFLINKFRMVGINYIPTELGEIAIEDYIDSILYIANTIILISIIPGIGIVLTCILLLLVYVLI